VILGKIAAGLPNLTSFEALLVAEGYFTTTKRALGRPWPAVLNAAAVVLPADSRFLPSLRSASE